MAGAGAGSTEQGYGDAGEGGNRAKDLRAGRGISSTVSAY